MRDVLFVVNDLDTLEAKQSTAELIARVATRGVAAWVASVDGLCGTPDGMEISARQWPGGPARPEALHTLRRAAPSSRAAITFDAVWVRTNPGRLARPGSQWLTSLLAVADSGVPVLNAPAGLVRASTKTYLGSLPPETVPRTWFSEDPLWLRDRLERHGRLAVLKPATGTRGHGVVRVRPDMPDLDALIAEAVQHGPALLQEYLEQAPDGDTRVHVVDGALLEHDGAVCAARRVPQGDEWRSNVALGGEPRPAALTEAQRATVARAGPTLRAHGLWHVGLDLVGDKIVECNVFSPGGLQDAQRFTGVDFIELLTRRFVERVRERAATAG